MNMNYRKIYKLHHGTIPTDEFNRTYDIHHIDNNHNNNDLSNLIAVSIEEHFNIHMREGNFKAAQAIALRMNIPIEEIRILAKAAAKQRIDDGTHHWLGGEFQKKVNLKLKEEGRLYFCSNLHKERTSERNKEFVKNGKHNFQSEKNKQRVTNMNKTKLLDGTHPFKNGVGAVITRKKIEDGTHHFLNSEKQKELSMRAKLDNSFYVKRIDSSNNSVIFVGINDAMKSTPGTTWRRIKKSAVNNHEYCGYTWKMLGKGFGSTTISEESTN